MEYKIIKGIRINNDTADTIFTPSFRSSDGSEFTINIDNEGNISTDNVSSGNTGKTLSTGASADGTFKMVNDGRLYINEVYCNDEGDEHTAGYCSHNFVELSNLTNFDINLSGCSLQYAIQENSWQVLPLKGVIKAGSTFLIRGAQCAAMDGAKIKVTDYDIEWRLPNDNTLIKFSTERVKFALMYGITPIKGNTPYTISNNGVTVDAGFIDVVGISGKQSADGSANSPYNGIDLKNRLFKRYYAMDPVKQATKALSARTSSADWNYVDLTKDSGEIIPSVENFTPKASKDKKNIFYNKTKLIVDKPSMITCSFGIQATDNGENSGATRCFNWVSKGLHNEYIWIREQGHSTWGEAHESIKNSTDDVEKYYNRKCVEYTDGSVFTAHKYIKRNLRAGTYEYIAGHKDKKGNPILSACTDVRTFTVRTTADVIKDGFHFVQTSDQQGFNWDEYQVWTAAANVIVNEANKRPFEFMINTGDMTQNGNRMGEWLDYFNGKNDYLNNMEEMATIGNNDMSPAILYNLGDGEDSSKIDLQNIEFFYTFEIDKNNPPVFAVEGKDIFVPSIYSFNYGNVHFLCMDSEIKSDTEKLVYKLGSDHNLYPKIKGWAEKDMELNSGYSWNIAYCHEMPFTILTTSTTLSTAVLGELDRKGSNMNINTPDGQGYWFSEFCQTHNIRLVLGGHKHTQATSYPLLENVLYEGNIRTVKSYHPIICVDETTIGNFDGSTDLVSVGDYKYPDRWVERSEDASGNVSYNVSVNYTGQSRLCTFEFIKNLDADTTVPVVYAMSQATGYKHTSNKELPAPNIPWLKNYYPTSSSSANEGQKYPFFTVWSVNENKIEGQVRKIEGAFNDDGKFDINIDGQYVLNGFSSIKDAHTNPLKSINGLSDNTAENSTEIIEITK